MAEVYETVIGYLKREEWKFIEHERGVVLMFSGRNGNFHCALRIDGPLVTFYVNVGLKAPPDARGPMAELVARINYGLRLGNFEFDPEDGELRYKNSLNVEESTLSDAMCRHLLMAALATTDRYLPALHRVALGACSPAAAVEQIERLETAPKNPGHKKHGDGVQTEPRISEFLEKPSDN